MARRSFKAGALTAPLPPVLVTVGNMESANVLTVAWTGILATQPPKTYISVRPSRHSHGMLTEGGEFVINLPSADMARIVDYVGIYTGAKVDKFEVTGLSRVPSEHVAPPTIAECPVALECRVCEVISMGTHDVFIADILGVSSDESIIDESGKLCFDRANLLAYAHGEYYALGERLGEFGFSAKKEKKAHGAHGSAAGNKASTRGRADGTESRASARRGHTDDNNGHSRERNGEQKRPFYLDAPRRGGKSKAKGGSRKRK